MKKIEKIKFETEEEKKRKIKEFRENEQRIADQKAVLEMKKQEELEQKKTNQITKMQQIKESIVNNFPFLFLVYF
jgi:hypothetical protein